MTGLRTRRMAFTLIVTCLMLSPLALMLVDTSTPRIASVPHVTAELTINHPPDMTFENGTRGKKIVWNATDPEPKNFTVTRNGEVYDSGDWNGTPVVVNLDHLYAENLTHSLPVSFTFVCTAFNMQNESVSDEVVVTVIADESPPIIQQPENITYEEGSFGHYIRWNITEANPDSYNVTRESNDPTCNFTVIEGGKWDGSNITMNVDGLNATYWYLYTLFVNDTFGRNATSVVNVTVEEDLTPPQVDSPADIAYEFGSKGHKISWKVYDSNPKNYTIVVTYSYINKTYGNLTESSVPLQNITQSDWKLTNPEGDTITVVIDNLYLGNYTYNITLFDDCGRHSSDALNVTVYEDLRPPVVNATPDFTYEEGYSGYLVNWTVEESNPKYFELSRDGVGIENGTWHDRDYFELDADGLSVGTHIFNLTLVDFFNQTTKSIVNVTVTPDAHLPTVSQVAALQAFHSATENNLSVQAYVWDLNGISSVKVEWFVGEETPSSANMTPVSEGLYMGDLGAFSVGTTVYYRVVATDNSSVHNVHTTEWTPVVITAMTTEPTPMLLWVPILIVGVLSSVVIMSLYFRTRTR
ncbi:MAG: hypothetical protein ACTSUH_02885 [Candidatus Thorarchaeota archaeon]